MQHCHVFSVLRALLLAGGLQKTCDGDGDGDGAGSAKCELARLFVASPAG